jgi:hypothetical protein
VQRLESGFSTKFWRLVQLCWNWGRAFETLRIKSSDRSTDPLSNRRRKAK